MQNTSPTQTVTLVQQAFGLTTQQVAGYANLMIVLHMLSSTYPRVVGSIFFCSSVFLLWSDILGIVVTDKTGLVASNAPPSATEMPTRVLDYSISDSRLEDYDMQISEQTSNPKIADAVQD